MASSQPPWLRCLFGLWFLLFLLQLDIWGRLGQTNTSFEHPVCPAKGVFPSTFTSASCASGCQALGGGRKLAAPNLKSASCQADGSARCSPVTATCAAWGGDPCASPGPLHSF